MRRFLAWLCPLVMRAVGGSLRMSLDDRGGILNHPDHAPVVIAFWHNRIALMAYFYWRYCRSRDALTFISRSRDGEFITAVAAQFGIKAVRGSSSRHGTSAMLAAIRAAKDQRVDLVITPDGPRGPRHQIRPGVLRLAQATERSIVAVTYDLKWKVLLKSWDRFHVGIPFSVCCLKTSEPIPVPKHASEAELAAIGRRLAEALGGD